MKTLYVSAMALLVSASCLAGAPPKSTPELIAKGKAAFTVNCVICHGDNGDGNGPAGAAMNPKPRNFNVGQFKGGGAADQLFKTISTGLPGTSMPAFGTLSEDDRWGLVYYVQSFKKSSK